MLLRLLKSLFARASEATLSIVFVVVCFAMLVGLLAVVFPSGTSLNQLIEQATGQTRGRLGSGGNEGRDLYVDGFHPDAAIGRIEEMHRTVKARGAQAVSWKEASVGLPLHDHDAVQTLKRSSAVIGLGEEQELELGQNTLVVLKRMDRSLLPGGKRSYHLMVDGELRGRLVGGKEKPVQLEIETPTGVARFRQGPDPEEEVEFKVQVGPDQVSTVTVEKGEAEVETKDQKLLVKAGEVTKLTKDEIPAAPRKLLNPPEPEFPAPGSVFRYRAHSPEVEFRWREVEAAEKYRFILSKDRDGRERLEDQIVDEPRYASEPLNHGEFYWWVAGIQDGVEITKTKPTRVRMMQDRVAPDLIVEFPDRPVTEDTFVLRGSTDPRSRLVVCGEQVEVGADGRFEHSLSLNPGLNVVVVESFDQSGNVTYRSRIINRKY
jgi:hypothetical protein